MDTPLPSLTTALGEQRLGRAHRAVLDWCATQRLQPAGPHWEIYGPQRDDPEEVWTEVCYLLSSLI